MRRPPGHSRNAHGIAQVMRRELGGNPFLQSPTQWGVVETVHGSTSTTLASTATMGATTISLTAAPLVNDMLVIGSLTAALRVKSFTGSGPFSVLLAQQIPETQSSGVTVTALKTLDIYLHGTQNPSPASAVTWGVRYLTTYSPTVNDVVVLLRGSGGLQTDRLVLGKLA